MQTINNTPPNSGLGDSLKLATDKINQNFIEIDTNKISGIGTLNIIPIWNGSKSLGNSPLTNVAGSSRILLGGASDDGSSVFQANGIIRATEVKSTKFINTSNPVASAFLKADGSTDSTVYVPQNNITGTAGNYSVYGSSNTLGAGILYQSAGKVLIGANGTFDADVAMEITTGKMKALGFRVAGGTSSQFLKGDGSVDNNVYALASASHNPVTLGTANGLSLNNQQLSLGLSSSIANGALSSTDWNTFNSKEPAIIAGNTAQYYRGDKTWQNLNTSVVQEGTNLYFTSNRVLQNPLTGFVIGTNTVITSSDTILQAFGKIQGQISDNKLWLRSSGNGSLITLTGNNTASGLNAIAYGTDNIASGVNSVASGEKTQASGNYSFAKGYQTSATTYTSTAEGSFTLSSNDASHAEGSLTQAIGAKSHAEGDSTIASGTSSHAEGFNTASRGLASHAEGQGTIAIGSNSHAEGGVTISRGNSSHAEGFGSESNGDFSHAGGFNTRANGLDSFVHGRASTAGGNNTIVLGRNIIGNADDTTYVDNLNIKTVPVGTSVNNLGIDASGRVVVGTSGGGNVTSVFGRSGVVVAQAGDYSVAQISGLQTALDGKSNVGHGHAITDITNLQTTLNGKSNVGHGHSISEISGLQGSLDSKSNVGHTHTIAEVGGLQGTLDSKANTNGSNASGTWGINITGTAGNANALAGQSLTTSSTPSSVVQRDGGGYITNTYFHTTGGGSERNGSGQGFFAGFNSSDYYIRSYTAQAAATLLNGTTMNINGSSTSCTGNANSANLWGGRAADLGSINNSTSYVLVVNPDGAVRIGQASAISSFLGLGANAFTSTPYFPLAGGTLNGGITASGNISAPGFFQSSDKKLKDILFQDGEYITYKWKDGRDNKIHFGVIAQEVKDENLVTEDVNGYLAVNYIELMLKKISDLEKEIKKLKNGVE